MDKQTAQKLLDEMPEGTTHVHGSGNYFKTYNGSVYVKSGKWIHVENGSLAMQQYHASRSVEQLREIAGEQTPSDPVHKPKHYEVIDGLEAIEVIASSLTRDEWKGYCVGNILKYRLRAGKKDALQQDIDKANEYEMLFDKYKGLNRNGE